MAQLRRGYPEIQKVNGEVLQITHSTAREAQLYLRRFPMVIPYLCDAERIVHEQYGIPLKTSGPAEYITNALACSAATVSDLIRQGERSPSPVPFFKRYGLKDSPQAIYIVDRDSIVRHVFTAGPIGRLPSNAEIVAVLEGLRQLSH
jgi:hypothetical protein